MPKIIFATQKLNGKSIASGNHQKARMEIPGFPVQNWMDFPGPLDDMDDTGRSEKSQDRPSSAIFGRTTRWPAVYFGGW